MIAYPRCQPVHMWDANLVTSSGEPLQLRLPEWTHGDTPGQKRQSIRMPPVFHHELFPIVPPLRLLPLPAAYWQLDPEACRRAWCDAMSSYYVPYASTAYVNDGVPGGLGIFGHAHNPLSAVVELAGSLDRAKEGSGGMLLIHYVFAVALQYYLVKRGCFLRVRTDAAMAFSDALPPWIVVMARTRECRGDRHAPDVPLTDANVCEMARTRSFPAFLRLVLAWLRANDARAASLISEAVAKKYVDPKLSKNFMQAMTTTRFREVVPVNLCLSINHCLFRDGGVEYVGPAVKGREKPRARTKSAKFFPHPNAAHMRTLDPASVPAVVLANTPYFFCHMLFEPDEPILADDIVDANDVQRQKHLLWKLACYLPLSQFSKTHATSAARHWLDCGATQRLFPSTAKQKVDEYDACFEPLRGMGRYSMYVRHDVAYAYVLGLLTFDGHAIDERDVRCMTSYAWEWCTNVGVAYASIPASPPPDLDCFQAFVVRRQIEAGPTNPYWYMYAIQLVTGREQDGVASVHALGYSRYDVQQAYATIQADFGAWLRMQLATNAELVRVVNVSSHDWDRCGRVYSGDPDSDSRRLGFDACVLPRLIAYMYSSSVILCVDLNGNVSAWSCYWARRELCPQTLQVLQHARAMFRAPVVTRELCAITDWAALPEHTRRQLLCLRDFFGDEAARHIAALQTRMITE